MARLWPLVLLLCGALPAALAQCSARRAQPSLARYTYEFAVKLSTRIAQDKENHFVAATLSPWTLLAVAATGAAGSTLEELRKVLGLHGNQCFNDKYFELVRSVSSEGTNVTLERSSTIFVEETLGVLEEFRRRAAAAGASEVRLLSFENAEDAVATINEVVTRATRGAVSDVVVPTDLDGVYLVMIDALHFKGPWQTPFAYEDTETAPFFNDRGLQVGEVNMMAITGSFNMSSMELIHAKVLELPFDSSGRYAMLVVLPHVGATLSSVIDALMRISLTTIYQVFHLESMQTVAVEMPRFKIVTDHDNMKELLVDMGLVSAFDSQVAEFPFVSEQPLYITNFVQKASIEVTEEGAAANAATAALFGTRSSPGRFKANKPFFYMIVDKQTQLPIFTGAYSKPSLY